MGQEIHLEQCPIGGRTDSLEQDASLARAIAGGDADAWDRFFDRFSAWSWM